MVVIESEPAGGVGTRRAVTDAESRVASRRWWDQDADEYQDEHGAFLGDVDHPFDRPGGEVVRLFVEGDGRVGDPAIL